MVLNIMNDRIENRFTGVGVPSDIYRHDRPLNNQQQRVLNELPETGSRAVFGKDDVSMMDLSALTAKTGDEFAMFTLGSERVVIRGDEKCVDISKKDIEIMVAQGYRWSGHTHPGSGLNVLRSSPGDRTVLKAFNQETSVIYNSIGEFQTFTYVKRGGQHDK